MKKFLSGLVVAFAVVSAWWLLRSTAWAEDRWGWVGVVVLPIAVVPPLLLFARRRPRRGWLRIATACAVADVLMMAAVVIGALAT